MTKFLPDWLQQLADQYDENNSTFSLSPIDSSPTTCNNVLTVKEHNGRKKMYQVILNAHGDDPLTLGSAKTLKQAKEMIENYTCQDIESFKKWTDGVVWWEVNHAHEISKK